MIIYIISSILFRSYDLCDCHVKELSYEVYMNLQLLFMTYMLGLLDFGVLYSPIPVLHFKDIYSLNVRLWFSAMVTAGCLWRVCLWHFIPLSDHKCSFVAFLRLSMCLSPSTTGRRGSLQQSHPLAHQVQPPKQTRQFPKISRKYKSLCKGGQKMQPVYPKVDRTNNT